MACIKPLLLIAEDSVPEQEEDENLCGPANPGKTSVKMDVSRVGYFDIGEVVCHVSIGICGSDSWSHRWIHLLPALLIL